MNCREILKHSLWIHFFVFKRARKRNGKTQKVMEGGLDEWPS